MTVVESQQVGALIKEISFNETNGTETKTLLDIYIKKKKHPSIFRDSIEFGFTSHTRRFVAHRSSVIRMAPSST